MLLVQQMVPMQHITPARKAPRPAPKRASPSVASPRRRPPGASPPPARKASPKPPPPSKPRRKASPPPLARRALLLPPPPARKPSPLARKHRRKASPPTFVRKPPSPLARKPPFAPKRAGETAWRNGVVVDSRALTVTVVAERALAGLVRALERVGVRHSRLPADHALHTRTVRLASEDDLRLLYLLMDLYDLPDACPASHHPPPPMVERDPQLPPPHAPPPLHLGGSGSSAPSADDVHRLRRLTKRVGVVDQRLRQAL